MNRVKKLLTRAAKKDREAIENSENYKTTLNNLLANVEQNKQVEQRKQNGTNLTTKSTIKTMICPDCGNSLVFNPTFGRFMHENCEKLNCWYAANDLGECVDNNKMRAKRIAEFNGGKSL